MDENTTELLHGLTEAMEKMPNDPQGVAGWLLSNYRMEKVGDGEPTGFHRAKKQATQGTNQAGVAYTDDKQEKLNEFFKRAQAPDLIGTSKDELIKRNRNMASAPMDGGDDLIDVNDPSLLDPAYSNINISEYVSENDMAAIGEGSLPETDNMSPELRSLLQQQARRQMSASSQVASGAPAINPKGVRGFSRGC